MTDKNDLLLGSPVKMRDNNDNSFSPDVRSGDLSIVSVTAAVSTGTPYTAGDAIGVLLEFTDATRIEAGGGIINAAYVIDQNKQSPSMDLILFSSRPTGTSVTDNSTLDINDNDLATRFITVIPISAYSTFNDNAVGYNYPLGIPYKLPSGTTLFGFAVARSTPTFITTTDIVIKLSLLRD